MKKGLPSVFANRRVGIINNNEETYYSKESEKNNIKSNDIVMDENFRKILINKKINDLFNSSSFVYKVNAIITTKEGDKNVALIAKGKDSLLTITNEKINIDDILDIKRG